MRLPEQRVWDAMRRAAPSWIWLERIENLASDGIPDVRGIRQPLGREFWVELKAATLPRRVSSLLLPGDKVRRSQINWHLRQASFGGRSWVVVRDSERRLYCVPGVIADRLPAMTVTEFEPHRAASWSEIFERITE